MPAACAGVQRIALFDYHLLDANKNVIEVKFSGVIPARCAIG
jgi:hypothetical protein